MSVERCDKHDRRYDTDFVEACPRCAAAPAAKPAEQETPLSVAAELIVTLLERLPRNPTPEMVAAGVAAHAASPVFEAARIVSIWTAMYDAALAKRGA